MHPLIRVVELFQSPFTKAPCEGFPLPTTKKQVFPSVSPSLLGPAWFLRENILKTAKALVEDTKLLVSGAASTPDKLAQAAQSSAATITQLAEVVKLGAASLGSDDPETQVWTGPVDCLPCIPTNNVHQASEEGSGHWQLLK